jgi:2-amino-4-hydroxy-6-hydroxymethyldihydropteridine diphosphokinase
MNGHRLWIALGSNQGDRAQAIASAIEGLAEHLELEAVSSLWETAPVGDVDQAAFLNAVARCTTRCTPATVLLHCLSVEASLGRVRDEARRWGPRVIDLDLLLMGNVIVDVPGLTLPHPRLQDRAFVLAPLAELDSDLEHPVTGRTMAAMLQACIEADGPLAGRCDRVVA